MRIGKETYLPGQLYPKSEKIRGLCIQELHHSISTSREEKGGI
jgi:hypothetical protein